MNQAYRLVWSATQQAWTVASELAKGHKKSKAVTLSAGIALLTSMGIASAQAAPAVNALPTGESVVSGNATFDRSVSNQLTVNQSTGKLITNWNSFDVGANATVTFAQPDVGSVALNRVSSGSPTEIFGQVSANGQLMIVNPSGIVFGAGSQVSATSLLASVLDIADSDFENDNLFFDRNAATGSIENHGILTATSGTVALLAPTISNTGSIVALGGDANLISADSVAGYGADVSQFSTVSGIIKNTGAIQATRIDGVGGRITLTGDSSDASSKLLLGGSFTADDRVSLFGRSVEVNDTLALNGFADVGADDSIYFNADVNVSSGKDLNLFHGEAGGQGYFLDKAAKVNLGTGTSFSVNDLEYTVIQDVNQLQAMNDNKTGRYVLGADIDASDTVNWNGGEGFVPIGGNRPLNGGEYVLFTGSLHGLGHRIDSLTMNRPGYWGVGLIGYAQGITVRDIGLTNISLQAGWSSAPLVGFLNYAGVASTILNVYTTGTFNVPNTARGFFGGLIGVTGSTSNGGTVLNLSNSYSSVNINATTMQNGYVGGLIGGFGSRGSSNISNVYYSGAINTQTSNVGGILGGILNDEQLSLNNAYASGTVLGSSTVGGIVGRGFSTLTLNNSYWNTETTGQASAIGNNTGTRNQVTGLTTAQSTQLSSYANWGSDIDAVGGSDAVWRIYEGQTAPLLRSFLKPLSVNGSAVSKTYDASTFTAGSYTLSDATADSSKILGTAQYGGTAIGARNAGIYDLTVSGLYSGQQGYDLSFADAQLTINKAALSITATNASKTYDGSTSAKATAVVADGTLYGTDSISGGTFSYDNKNAATNKHVSVSGVTLDDGNGGNNYDVTYVDNTNSSIGKKLLTISAAADSKEYDGRLWSNIRPVVTGRVSGDSIAGLSQSFTDKNAGTGKTLVVDAGFVIRDGNKGNNYQVVVLDNHSGIITPKQLIISTVANSKVYDGGVTSVNKPLVTGLAYGDRITGLFQQYESKTVGENKKLLIKSGYVVQDGNSGANYTVTEQTSNDGVITVH